MNSKLLQSLQTYLVKNATGEFEIRWRMFGWIILLLVFSTLAGQLVLSYFTGIPLKPFRFASTTLTMVLSMLTIVIVGRNYANGQSIWRFSMRSLLLAITAFSVIWTFFALDQQSEKETRAERAKLEAQILEIVGDGSVSVSGTPGSTFVGVNRASFDDRDLKAILQFQDRLEEVDAPITFLDFSSTNLTNQGVSLLLALDSLEHCYLNSGKISEETLVKIQRHTGQTGR